MPDDIHLGIGQFYNPSGVPAHKKKWCEECQDYFLEDHYNLDLNHKVGKDFGSTGKQLFMIQTADRLADVINAYLIDLRNKNLPINGTLLAALHKYWEACK